MSDVELRVFIDGKRRRGRSTVVVVGGENEPIARDEINLDKAEEREAFVRQVALSAPGLNGQVDELRRQLMNLTADRPRRSAANDLFDAGDAKTTARPEVLIPGQHVDDQGQYTEVGANIFTENVVRSLPAGSLYRRGDVPGEITGDIGSRYFLPASTERARIVIDANIRCVKWISGEKAQVKIYVPVTRDLSGLFLAAAATAPRIPNLRLLTSHPIFLPGFALAKPGYFDGVFFDQPADLADLKPENDREVIAQVLEDMIIDFPWKNEASKENYFGLMITPLVRPALEGNVPLHLIVSALERTGKSKLIEEGIGGIYLGRKTPAMQASKDDTEMDKRIIAILLRGDTIIHLDNLRDFIDSAALASLMTASSYSGRMLGASKMVTLPNNVTIVGTANTPRATGEIVKRSVPIEIQPKDEAPELRTDFVHPDFFAYVLENRRSILSCLLGMVEIWKAAGQPRGDVPFGGFNLWADVIGGILSVSGYSAWMSNVADWRHEANPQGQDLKALVEEWAQVHGSGLATVQEILEIAQRLDVFPDILSQKNPKAVQTSFGMRVLSRHVNTPVGKWIIRRNGVARPACYYLQDGARKNEI